MTESMLDEVHNGDEHTRYANPFCRLCKDITVKIRQECAMICPRVQASFNKQSLMETFSARLCHAEAGLCEIEAPILPGARQQQGAGHAGLTFALGDVAAGYAALTMMPEDVEVMTVEMKINLLAPAFGDLLRARGEVVQAGRRLTIVRAEVFALRDGQQRSIALLQGTMIPVDL
jgi:uncharacterized protein (TIGR00369 family)